MPFIPVPSTPGQAALIQALFNVQLQLQQLTANPKPSYSAGGRNVSWGEHFRNLVDLQKEIRSQIQAEDAAFEVVTVPPGVGPFGAPW
jgi:hypothetical protein